VEDDLFSPIGGICLLANIFVYFLMYNWLKSRIILIFYTTIFIDMP
jgi:hypothetical protein